MWLASLGITLFAGLLWKSGAIVNNAPMETTTEAPEGNGTDCIWNEAVYGRCEVDEDDLEIWESGVRCLFNISDMYFHDRTLRTKIPNTIITYLVNMSNAAENIQDIFIKRQNEVIGSGRSSLKHQLWIVSDVGATESLSEVPFNALVVVNYYIIVIDDVDRIDDLTENVLSRMSAKNPSGKFLVLYSSIFDRENGHEVASVIFNLMNEKFGVADITLLYATGPTTYDIFISIPYQAPDCEKVQVKKLSTCDNGVVQSEGVTRFQLQLSRLPHNLKSCTFKLCARISEPYVEPSCSSGLEMDTLSIIRSRFRFKLNKTCTYQNRGVFENDSWTDLLGKIMEGQCDFVMGGFFPDNDVKQFFGVSTPYMSDVYNWYVALAPLSEPWKNLVSIFEIDTWLCFLAVLFVSAVIWFFLGNLVPDLRIHRFFIPSFLNAWSINVGVSIESRPLTLPLRILFIALTLYSMNLTGIYTSNLIAVFSTPSYDRQISSIYDIIAAKMPFGGREEYADWFDNGDEDYILEHYNTTDDFKPIPPTLFSVVRGEKAILANQMYILCQPQKSSLFECPETVFSSPLQIITRLGFPLLEKFNWMIRQLKVSGIFAKIRSDLIYNKTYLEKIKKYRPEFQMPRIVLTTDHLQGAFAVMLIGLTASTVVFFAELFFHKICRKEKASTDADLERKFFEEFGKTFNEKEYYMWRKLN